MDGKMMLFEILWDVLDGFGDDKGMVIVIYLIY